MDFICMADAGYLRWTELCVRAIERSHPGAAIHLFDLSEERHNPLSATFGEHAVVRLEHYPPSEWKSPAWIEQADFDFIWPRFGLRDTLKYHSRRLRKALGAHNDAWMTDKAAHVRRVRHFLRLVAQKPRLIERVLDRSRGDAVFIDADAIVLKPLAPVFERQFDFAVTAEEPPDVIVGPEPVECTERPSVPWKAINVGVMFARNSAATRRLIGAWIAEMEVVRHLSIEQTALAHLILRLAPDFFASHYRPARLALESGDVTVLALPMDLYNFTHVKPEDAGVAADKLVVHFCGGKKQERHWPWVQKIVSGTLKQ
jgi:hypothetical protein